MKNIRLATTRLSNRKTSLLNNILILVMNWAVEHRASLITRWNVTLERVMQPR